jgi:hypothetical protein
MMTTTPAVVAADDQLVEFTVLARPFKALRHLMTLMTAELARAAA